MSEVEKQESQKTVVAFIAGLLIGGLLVWIFGGDTSHTKPIDESHEDEVEVVNETQDEASASEEIVAPEETSVPTLNIGAGNIEVKDQPAGSIVKIDGATYPNDEGWMGVRDYNNGKLSGLLGVARFSKEQGLVPEEIEILRDTEAGKQYAIVFYSESGDRKFNLAEDVQLDDVVAAFTAK